MSKRKSHNNSIGCFPVLILMMISCAGGMLFGASNTALVLNTWGSIRKEIPSMEIKVEDSEDSE